MDKNVLYHLTQIVRNYGHTPVKIFEFVVTETRFTAVIFGVLGRFHNNWSLQPPASN
jgi:hypothetical protein